MDFLAFLIALLAGLVLGAGGLWLLVARRLAREANDARQAAETAALRAETVRQELADERIAHAGTRARGDRVDGLEEKLAATAAALADLGAERSRLETRLVEQERAQQEKLAVLASIRGEIEKDLKALADKALESNQTRFFEVANQMLAQHKEATAAEHGQRREAIEALVKPMAETLTAYRKELGEIEKARQEGYGQLTSELRNVVQLQGAVRTETSKLVNALRAAPKTRGRWGEHQLRNVMELSGMAEHVDFQTEQSFDGEGGRLRPDAIIRLPGERFIVVDAKTSMSAYLDALEAVEDQERERLLMLHAGQIRTHMKQLSAKSYWDGLTVTPDFVAMFVPGENLFAAAVERAPDLFEEGIKGRVLVVTPTTLVALLKAVAFGWRQEKVAENARHVGELGQKLYARLCTMGEHVVRVGKGLDSAVSHYNSFVGSLESSVMPQARSFAELHVAGTDKPLPMLEPVERDVREPRRDRDLLFEPTVTDGAAAGTGSESA